MELNCTNISVCQAQLAGLHLQITVGEMSGSREGSTAPSPPPNLGFEEPSSSSSGKLWPVACVNELDTLRPTLLESLSGNQVSMGQGHVFRFTRKHSSHSLTLLHAMKPARPLQPHLTSRLADEDVDKIVGGVIGGVFGFLLLTVLPVILFFWIRKRKLAAAGGSKVRVELWSSHNMPAWITDQPVGVPCWHTCGSRRKNPVIIVICRCTAQRAGMNY